VILPFPTAVLADAFGSGNYADEQAAVTLYSVVAMLMSASWLVFFQLLHRRPCIASAPMEPAAWKRERHRAALGVVGYALAGGLGVIIKPAISLALFLLISLFYALTSEGLPVTRRPAGSPAATPRSPSRP
jgi:hypothetical protein